MALTETDWQAIVREIAKQSRRVPEFLHAKVVKADPIHNIIWVKEIPDHPIPIYSFDYEVKYYDVMPHPTSVVHDLAVAPRETVMKKAKVKVLCPEVGETVLIILQWGAIRLPRCVGVLRSTNFVVE